MSPTDLVDKLAMNLEIVSSDIEPSNPSRGKGEVPNGYARPRWELKVPRRFFDYFFNSPSGYRGWYARDPDFGVKSNDVLLHRIKEPLLAKISAGLLDKQQIALSLTSTPWAKIWIAEPLLIPVHHGNEEILWPRWLENRQKTDPEGIGLRALEGDTLKIFGGFVSSQTGQVFCVPSKMNRAQQIYETRFS